MDVLHRPLPDLPVLMFGMYPDPDNLHVIRVQFLENDTANNRSIEHDLQVDIIPHLVELVVNIIAFR